MLHNCPICNNATVEGSLFCRAHDRAQVQFESAFGKWQHAYGSQLEKRAFLERLLQLPETGRKSCEVARFLLEKGST